MLRAVLLAVVAAACVGVPEPPPRLAVSLACAADTARVCPFGGCDGGDPGRPSLVPIALSVPSAADIGRMCVATSCEDARYLAHFDGARGWVAEVFTGAEWTRPGGDLVISPDRRSFRLRQHVSDGYTEWLGYCAPSGS